MRGRILMLLLFAANAQNYMDVLELKSMIYKILQGNDKIAERLEKVEKMEGVLQLVKTQVQDNAFYIKLPECVRWLQTQHLNKSNFFIAKGKHFYFDLTNGTWNGARELCTERGMQLAMLKTASQMDAVKTELKDRDAFHGSWLDASDVGQPAGQFRWADGTLVDETTWKTGTIYKQYRNLSETTCVEFYSRYARLTDQHCSAFLYILCQVPTALAACL